ncbi:aerotolerance protein [Pontibacter beigongshangensis]|uniref:aerotolerance protein n=1 Tax=Pontibacter beigongshangensis TaxID=2574733 RepID=UPI00164F67C7|nr:aerotolerance protein [Pontibacter beigongshangensis]
MKAFFVILFLVSLFGGGIRTISQINRFAREAALAYQQQDYATAIASYEYLLNELDVQDDQISLNLAHAYYKAGLLEQSLQQYQQLASHPFQHIRAVAALQSGNIAAERKKYKQALQFYKRALVAEPGNDNARFNYELLKKYLALHPEIEEAEAVDAAPEEEEPGSSEVPPPTEEDQTLRPKMRPDSQGTEQQEIETEERAEEGTPENRKQSGEPTDQMDDRSEDNRSKEKEQEAGQEAGNTEGLRTETNPDQAQSNKSASAETASEEDPRAQTSRNRLRQMNISPEKARMLLNAMQSAELQYIQQLPKKATKKPDSSKPDW